MDIRNELAEMYDDELIFMDGYDDCIVGIMERFGMEPIVMYDKWAVIEKHIEDGMSIEEAYEFFENNQIGAWVGVRTPAFLNKLDCILDT